MITAINRLQTIKHVTWHRTIYLVVVQMSYCLVLAFVATNCNLHTNVDKRCDRVTTTNNVELPPLIALRT